MSPMASRKGDHSVLSVGRNLFNPVGQAPALRSPRSFSLSTQEVETFYPFRNEGRTPPAAGSTADRWPSADQPSKKCLCLKELPQPRAPLFPRWSIASDLGAWGLRALSRSLKLGTTLKGFSASEVPVGSAETGQDCLTALLPLPSLGVSFHRCESLINLSVLQFISQVLLPGEPS